MSASERSRSQIAIELATAREQVDRLESELSLLKDETSTASASATLPLSLREYRRYGRQMILNEIGLPGTVIQVRRASSTKFRSAEFLPLPSCFQAKYCLKMLVF